MGPKFHMLCSADHLCPRLSQLALPAWVTFLLPEYLLGLLPQGLCICFFLPPLTVPLGICMVPSPTSFRPLLKSHLFVKVNLIPNLILLPTPHLFYPALLLFPQYGL